MNDYVNQIPIISCPSPAHAFGSCAGRGVVLMRSPALCSVERRVKRCSDSEPRLLFCPRYRALLVIMIIIIRIMIVIIIIVIIIIMMIIMKIQIIYINAHNTVIINKLFNAKS